MPGRKKDFLNSKSLKEHNLIPFTCSGGSMRPLIRNGQVLFIKPGVKINIGDCICYKVKDRSFVHRVISKRNDYYRVVSDSLAIKSHWIHISAIIGKVKTSNPLLMGKTGALFSCLMGAVFLLGRLIKGRQKSKNGLFL